MSHDPVTSCRAQQSPEAKKKTTTTTTFKLNHLRFLVPFLTHTKLLLELFLQTHALPEKTQNSGVTPH